MRFSIKYYCNVITEKFLFMYRGEIMDNYRMNYGVSRSCNCKMKPREMPTQASCMPRTASDCCCDKIEDMGVYAHADHFPLAMAYVPCQNFTNTFHLQKALQVGTIFPELCMPFCGKRGVCR